MNDGEREHAHNWLLAEDNRLFLFTFSSFALAVASLLIWRANHVDNHSVNDPQQAHSAQSILTAALSTLNITSRAPGECDLTVPQQPSTAEASTSADTEQKPSRSKERRRRGKVPYKEIVKNGKKTMAVLIATKPPALHDSKSLAFETESKSMTNNDNVAPPTSRSHSPALDSPEVGSVSLLNTDSPVAGESHEDSYPLPACMTASTSEPVSISRQTTVTYHSSTMRSSRSQHARPLDIPHNTQSAESPCRHDDSAPSIAKSSSLSLSEPSSLSLSDDYDIHERASSSTSQSQSMPPFASVSAHASDSGGPSQTYTISPRTKPPRFMSKQCGADNSNGSHTISGSISTNVIETSSATIHDSPPRITPSSSAPASSSSLDLNSRVPSPSSDSPTKLNSSPTLPHVTFPTLNPLQASANDHTHTHSSTIESPTLNGKKATPPIQTASRASTPPPGASAHSGRTDSPAGPLSAQTQLASMRGALEAARLREEKARAEAECLGKENEELKWRWSEDAMAWRRREGELQAQVHHLMQQLQAAYSVIATLQTQAQSPVQPSSSFSSPISSSPHLHPYSPSSLQNGPPQNLNYVPPAHVQALLASSYPPYPGFPGAHGGAGMSPLFFSGLGMPTSRRGSVASGHAGGRMGRYTSDTSSSTGSSPSRGRRRRPSSAQEINSEDINEAEEDQEDAWQNSILADAILKRPESLRMTSSRGSLRSDSRMSALESVSSIKEDASRVPSRMSERSDGSASRSSYGTSLSGEKGEDERYGAIVENGSILLGGAEAEGGSASSDLDAPTQDSMSSWDSTLAKNVQSSSGY